VNSKKPDSFSAKRKLGDGGFGTVYRGYMSGTHIAKEESRG